MVEPPFIWPGSKKDHLDKILPLIPIGTTRFIDVFGGSGVVLLNTPFHELDVYNDLNSNVYNFFKVLRENKEELIHKLEMHMHSREQFDEYRDHIYINEATYPDPVDQAVAWYYTVVCSFARLGRHYGRNMNASFETKRVYERIPYFEQVHVRLRHAYIENKNAFTLIKEFDHPESVFYLDPPYVNTDHGTYSGPKFTVDDHKALLCLIAETKGMVILSGEPCSFYDEETDLWDYKDSWPVHSKLDHRNRSKGRVECLWVKHSIKM